MLARYKDSLWRHYDWQTELFYRHLKQTYQRRKLRSAQAYNARLEMEWSLLGLWAMALYAQVELAQKQVPADKISIAGVLRAFRRMLRDYLHPADSRHSLCALVRRAILDNYHRTNKASRTDTRRKYEKPPGPPDIRSATRAQIKLAKQLAPSNKRVNGVEWHPSVLCRRYAATAMSSHAPGVALRFIPGYSKVIAPRLQFCGLELAWSGDHAKDRRA